MSTYYVVGATHGTHPEPVRHTVCVYLAHPTLHPITPSTTLCTGSHCNGATRMEQILLWTIGGLFAFTLIVPVALVIYVGAWLLFGDVSDDE